MEREWWKDAVVYEIYCKSFCDSDGDGIGDLRGVISKLPILHELGITCIWFTPIFTSPQVDNGYDVADYEDIDPAYGTIDDFRELLRCAHALGIRVILDMVLNHSSDEHRWFRESRRSKDNPYRNYYIWHAPKPDGSEPNNWGNYFREGNGSAWTFDEATGEYYLHQYSAKMPDLNWEYEPLRKELYAMMNRWLALGVDGFRFDVFTRFKKPDGFPDTKKAADPLLDHGFIVDRDMCTCVDGIHTFLRELHENVIAGKDIFTVGEGSGIHAGNAAEYITADRRELQSVYHFNLISRKRPPFTSADFRRVQSDWAEVLNRGGWYAQYFGNHDQPRAVSRYGDELFRVESAKLLAMLAHTTPGTPFLYQGEEIGMTNVSYDSIEDYNDRYTVGDYRSMIRFGMTPEDALAILRPKSRDNARAPYHWDGSKNAGFTTGTPWLKLNKNYREVNLEADRKRPDSIFAFYQALIRLRREHPAITDGSLRFLLKDDPDVIAYLRECPEETLLVLANKSCKTRSVSLPEELRCAEFTLLLGSRPESEAALRETKEFLPWEAGLYLLRQAGKE